MSQHPGRILKERFLAPLGLSASDLAQGLGVHRSTISRLLGGTQPLTPAMAARLGAYFDAPPRWFLAMQASYDAWWVQCSPELAQGVTPIELSPDVLVTPEGIYQLPEADAPLLAADEPRTVTLGNGSVALLGSRS